MPDNDRPFDPANPENEAILDGMERDGKTLRDIREGKTPTEQAFGVDLGSKKKEQDEHDALLSEIGEVVAQEEKRAAPEVAPVAIETPELTTPETIEIGPEDLDLSEPAPAMDVQAAHDDLLKDLGDITIKERKRSDRREEMARRRVEHRTRSEHGKAFHELGEVVEREMPEEPEPLKPDAMARLAHPGREKPHEFGEAFADFAHEDKEWRASAVALFQELANHIRQSRLELDGIRGMLERSRL